MDGGIGISEPELIAEVVDREEPFIQQPFRSSREVTVVNRIRNEDWPLRLHHPVRMSPP